MVPEFCRLSLANGVPDFYAGNRTPGGPKGFGSQQGTRESFHRSMILCHAMVERRTVSDSDVSLVGSIVVFDRRCVPATLVDRDLLGKSLGANRLMEKGLGRFLVARGDQEKIIGECVPYCRPRAIPAEVERTQCGRQLITVGVWQTDSTAKSLASLYDRSLSSV